MGRHPALSRDRTPSGVAQAFLKGEEGFTLIEVMAAMALFLVVSTSTVAIMVQGLQALRQNTDRVATANIARSEMEYLRDLARDDPAILPIGQFVGPVPPVVTSTDATVNAQRAATRAAVYLDPILNSSRYTIKTTSNWVDFASVSGGVSAQSPCSGNQATAAYLRVVVTVTSPNLKQPVSLQSNITQQRKPDSGAATDVGAAAITVVDENLMPVSDVVVTFSDSLHTSNTLPPMTTGFDGCVFVPNLTPTGSLMVDISRSGFVPSTPTGTHKQLSISKDVVTKVGFEYAAASALKFSVADPAYPLPTDMPVRWQVKGGGGSQQSNVLSGVVSGLWPGDDIDAWIGSCTDADPLSAGIARTWFTLSAGATTTAALAAAPVKLTGLKPDQGVTAKHTAGACNVTVALGNADKDGVLLTGLPYGDWSFKAAEETVTLLAPLVPPAPGQPPAVTTVPFLLQVDIKPTATPTPTPTDSPSGSPSASPPASPSPTASDTSPPGAPVGP
jgi:prepilin-type N-terminal cleavage/methylation domain-containing protein